MISKTELVHGNYYLVDGKVVKFTIPPNKKFTELEQYYRGIWPIEFTDEIFHKIRPELKNIFDKSKDLGIDITMYRIENDPYYHVLIHGKHTILIAYLHELQNMIRLIYKVEINLSYL